MEDYSDVFDHRRHALVKPATVKQIAFAKSIAITLDVPEPDYSNLRETAGFIAYWKDDFYAVPSQYRHNSGY